MRRQRSRNAGEVMESPGPCGDPALDVSTVMQNEGTLALPGKASTPITPVMSGTAATLDSSRSKGLHN
jgi:hypothetical protein